MCILQQFDHAIQLALVKVPVNKVLDTSHIRTWKTNQSIIIVKDIVPCLEDFWARAQQLHIFVHKVYE